jgi:hypothetical protein
MLRRLTAGQTSCIARIARVAPFAPLAHMAIGALAVGACDTRAAPSSDAAAPAVRSVQGSGAKFALAPSTGGVDAIVRGALSQTRADRRRLVVYVGATWCEPCQRFHHSLERGELGGSLADVTLLEFDLDADRERLAAAGYQSNYIPLFALPGPDGRSSGAHVEGGIKGEGAVAFILPRLEGLLAR